MRLPKPLRCDDVTGALSAPRAAIDLPGLAEHLAECPDCAAHVQRDAALTRLWESTRPLEPSAETWNTIWNGVRDRLDAQPETIPLRPRQRYTAIAFITAQAAAVLAAFVLWAAHRPAVDAPASHELAQAPRVEIDWGEPVVIHLEGHDLRTSALPRDEPLTGVDAFVCFNDVEAMAEMIHAPTPPG